MSSLCDPMDCSMPGLRVHHQLPEFAQTHVHWVSDDIQSSDPLSSPLLPTFNFFPAPGSFQMSQFFMSGGQSIEVSASASVLPINIQDWFPLGWTGWISLQSRGSQEASPTPQFKSINSVAFSFPYTQTLTFILDYLKNQSFDYMNLCLQSNSSAF